MIDPFAGGSVRGLVAAKLGMHDTGIDLVVRPSYPGYWSHPAQAGARFGGQRNDRYLGTKGSGGTESGLQESGRFFLFSAGRFLPHGGVSDPIDDFWRCFLKNRAEFAAAESIDDPVCDVILDALQRVNPGLWFEFCTTPGTHEFIISAEGERALFPLVEEIVAKAPTMEEWKIFALKPKLGFPVWNVWEGHEVTIADVVFLPVFHRESGKLGLQLYVDGLNEDNEDDAHNALLRAIDHGLGERRFAEDVSSTWVYPLSELPEGRQAIPLVELESYLDGLARDAAPET